MTTGTFYQRQKDIIQQAIDHLYQMTDRGGVIADTIVTQHPYYGPTVIEGLIVANNILYAELAVKNEKDRYVDIILLSRDEIIALADSIVLADSLS